MDVESPKHLERFRDQPEIKAVLLKLGPESDAAEARFERAAKNALYWPPIEALAGRFIATGRARETHEAQRVYGRSCWLLATALTPNAGAPFAIAMADAEGAPVETLLALLRKVSEDYWYGSYFFK